MKGNTLKIIIVILVIALIIGVCFLVPQIISNKDVETSQKDVENTQKEESNVEKDEQETEEKYGYVDKETMEVLFREFNVEIEENSGLGTIFDEEYTVKEGKYWYKITDGIYLVVNPVENNNSKQDVVASMSIYVEKDYKDDPQALAYTRLLIVANNEDIKYEEAQNLIDESLNLASKNLASNNGKGISVRYLEEDGNIEYQITRHYK